MNIKEHLWRLFTSALVFAVLTGWAQAATFPPACNVAPLPMTGTRIINVSTESQLQSAMANLQPGDTVVLANGTYTLSSSLYVNGKSNVTIRGTSGCDGVVLVGRGMNNGSYGNVPYGIWSNSPYTTIAHLTIRDTYENEIMFNPGSQYPHVYSVKLLNSGSQFVKSNPTDAANGMGVTNGVLEYSWMEYTAGTPMHPGLEGYTNGISAHAISNWVIRGNLFKNFHTPDTSLYLWNAAVLIWNHSKNNITEGNVFINVDRAVAYGLQDISSTGGHDNTGGIIRNNFIYEAPGLFSSTRKAGSDAMITVNDSANTLVDHNTVLTNNNVNRSIEFRFATTTGGEARNNLADLPIGARDSATYAQSGNYLTATATMFVNPAVGDLHLLDNTLTRSYVIDKVSTIALTVPNDFDGDVRPSGANADIGADELLQGATTPTPTPTPTGDTTRPSVNSFSMPYSSTSLTVPVTGFTASDNVGVTGYRITESSTAPTAGTTGWSAAPPTSFTFAGSGTRTAYAWVRDAAGNVSTSRSASVTVTAPTATTAGIAVDVTVYRDSSTAGSSITTPTFTTKGGNELLVAFVSGSAPSSGTNSYVTGVANTGTALTWNKAVTTNGQRGHAEIWWAYATTPISGTVTATMNQSSSSRSITVVTFTGTAAGSAAIGAKGGMSSASAAPSVTLTTTKANSLIYATGNDYTSPIARTLGSGQTMVHQFLSPTSDTYWVQRRTSPVSLAGTVTSIGTTAPTGDATNFSYVEIRGM